MTVARVAACKGRGLQGTNRHAWWRALAVTTTWRTRRGEPSSSTALRWPLRCRVQHPQEVDPVAGDAVNHDAVRSHDDLARVLHASWFVELDEGDNLIHPTDFRRVCARLIEGWLGANAQQVLRRFQRDSTFTRIVLTVQP